MRHYGMIEGQARYADRWYRGHQIALLADESGLWVGEDIALRQPMAKGTVLGHIYNLYGDVIQEVTAPEEGQVFGLRFRAMTRTGDWICFYAVVDEVRDNLIP
jgi:predicted deacylase